MSIAAQTSYGFFSGLDATKIHTGRTGRIFVRPGMYPITRGGYAPKHSVLLNTNLKGSQDPQVVTFYGGASAVSAVAQITVVTVEILPVAGMTFTVVGNLATKVYTFVASGATGDQINIGADTDATAANIDTKLTADAATIGITTIVTAGSVMTITGAASGAAFSVDYSDATYFDQETTTAGVTAVSAAVGKIEIKVVRTLFESYSKTLFRFRGIPTTDGNQAWDLDCWVEVADGDTEEIYLARVRSMLLSLISGNALTQPTRMYFRTTIELTRAELATILQALFGAPAAASANLVLTGTGSAAKLTLNAAAGTNGGTSYIEMHTFVEGSIAKPLLPIAGGQIIQPGWTSCGAQINNVMQGSVTTTAINADNEPFAISNPVTAQVANMQFDCLQDMDLEVQNLADSTGSRQMSGNNFEAMIFAARNAQRHWAVAHISEDPNESGKYDGTLLFYARSATGPNRNSGRANVGSVPMNFTPEPLSNVSPGCPWGMFFSINTNIAA